MFLAAVCALVAVGCGGGTMEESAAPPAEPGVGSDAASRPAAPAIEGISLDGDEISLADFRGRAVFVNVWASW
jgi:hypothetical protein